MSTVPSRDEIVGAVEAEGLVCLGVAPLDLGAERERLRAWIADGFHAGMDWLGDHGTLRHEPARMLEGARAVVSIALPYAQGDRLDDTAAGPRVAQYARFADYHKVLWRRGEAAAERLRLRHGGEFRVVADSAPVLERALAARTEKGFVGKNTCYIHPALGSFLLLGEIFTTLPIAADVKEPVAPERREADGGCGSCDKCQVHCPTGALDEDYRIDARRCLAYWTIENEGPIPEEFWPHLAKYYFGCDLCQLACPYNWRAKGNRLPETIPVRETPALFAVATMSEAEYEGWFHGTALVRAKRDGLRRNALVAMAVTADPRLGEAMERARADSSGSIAHTLMQIERYLAR